VASETSDAKEVFYASVDVPGLADLRSSIESALCEAGCPPSTVHGFTPHVTLAYLDPDEANPVDRVPSLDLTVEAVTVMLGEARIDIPLARPQPALFAVRDEDEQQALHVYQAVRFAEAPEWSPFLPVPGIYHHPIYGELTYTAETYDRIIGHFKEGIYQDRLPVNAEHDPLAAGAVGWITDMRLAESGAIEVKVDWNDRGRKLIEGDRYRYVSAELYPWWTDPVDPERTYQDVAVGMAMTTQPYFKERVLPPLVASEAALVRTAGDPGKEIVTMAEENQNTVQAAPETTVQGATSSPGEVTLAQLNEQKFGEFMQRFTQMEATVEAQKKTIVQLSARNDALQIDVRKKKFSDEVKGRSDENDTPWIGDAEKHIDFLVDLADKFGETSEHVAQYIQSNRQHAEQVRTSDLFRRFGTDRAPEGTGQAKIDAAAEAVIQANPKLTHAQAVTQVLSERPELYSEYNRGR
jgi:hypothetical protein